MSMHDPTKMSMTF